MVDAYKLSSTSTNKQLKIRIVTTPRYCVLMMRTPTTAATEYIDAIFFASFQITKDSVKIFRMSEEVQNVRIHIPVMTSIIISIALSLLFWLFNR